MSSEANGALFGRYLLEAHEMNDGPIRYYRARRVFGNGMERVCRLRRLALEFLEDEQLVQRVLDEARLMVSLDHPGIIGTLDYGIAGKELFVEEERTFGTTLSNIIAWCGSLSPGVALLVTGRLAEVLAFAHEARDANHESLGIVHRNLVPHHVHVTTHGEAKLSGFGLARFRGRLMQTQIHTVRENMGYVSPEELRGHPLDHRCDLFGLGVVLYEMLTGRPPFASTDLAVMRENIVTGRYRPLTSVIPGIEPRLSVFVDDLLQPAPDRRPASAEVVWERCWQSWRLVGSARNESQLRSIVASVLAPTGDIPLDETK